MNLGDKISEAMSLVGVDETLVSRWIGAPCGCRERQEKLNQLGYWAARVLRGKILLAKQIIEDIIREV